MPFMPMLYLKLMGRCCFILVVWSVARYILLRYNLCPPISSQYDHIVITLMLAFVGTFGTDIYKKFRKDPKCTPQNLRILRYVLWGYILFFGIGSWYITVHYVYPYIPAPTQGLNNQA